MPIFNVKKIWNSEEGQVEEVMEINVPIEVFYKIMVNLDGRGIFACLHVSQEWNAIIKEHVLGSMEGRKVTERLLQHQWREATPSKIEKTFGGLLCPEVPRVLSITDQFAVICCSLPSSDKFQATVVNILEGQVLMKLRAGNFEDPQALLSKDCLLVSRCVGDREVLAWNFHRKQKIFEKKFSAWRVVFDRTNKEAMVGNTRLEITADAIIENIQASLPVSEGILLNFSHPYYITRPVFCEDLCSLWKVEGTEVKRVRYLVGLGPPVFCSAREICVSCNVIFPTEISLTVFSLAGENIKIRRLTTPTAFNFLKSFLVNDNQLVVMVRQASDDQDILLVYELDCLLSQSADQDISPRLLETHQSNSAIRLALNKTSVSVAFSGADDRVKFITFDFWNNQD